MSMIFLATGNCYLGRTDRDKDGKIIKEIPPHFEHDYNGSCVILGKLNPDTMERIGEADIFGDFNASGYLNKALKLLNPQRNIDIPNLKEIVQSLNKDGVEICNYCNSFNCSNCIISEWKREADDE